MDDAKDKGESLCQCRCEIDMRGSLIPYKQTSGKWWMEWNMFLAILGYSIPLVCHLLSEFYASMAPVFRVGKVWDAKPLAQKWVVWDHGRRKTIDLLPAGSVKFAICQVQHRYVLVIFQRHWLARNVLPLSQRLIIRLNRIRDLTDTFT